jgi:tetratricopeptide (TPR) repeat protein
VILAKRSPRRRSAGFRWAAVLLIPLLTLGLVELGLRLAGFGYPTAFFVETRVGDREMMVSNDRFGWRFFPRAIARSPTPVAFQRAKEPGTLRIFLFGESAALGDPLPAYGMGRYVQALLESRYPQHRFEVIPAAMTAINSHALREMARECGAYEPDLWILYLGHNEMIGSFGATAVLGPKAPPLPLIRLNLALRSTRVGQALESLLRRSSAIADPAQWEGLELFRNHQIDPDDPARHRVHRHFRKNLDAMLSMARARRIPVIACTVASNLRDCPPFASRHRRDLDPEDARQWTALEAALLSARTNLAASRVPAALATASQLDPQHAETRYLLGTLELAHTNRTVARDHFQAALDHDALPFRTSATLNEIVRQLAAARESSGVSLVDLDDALGRVVADGSPGLDVFFDHVHFHFAGNEAAARLVALEAERRLQPRLSGSPTLEWAGTDAVDARLILTPWNRLAGFEHMLARLQRPPFVDQIHQDRRTAFYNAQIAQLRQQTSPERARATAERCRAVLERHPDDPHLHANTADFLELTGDLPGALDAWRRVADLLPHHVVGWYQSGRLHARLGQWPESRMHLTHALRLRPDLDEARLELGQVLFRERQPAAALLELDRLTNRPAIAARAYRHRADPLAALQRRTEAVASLQQAVQLQPNLWDARYFLGVELAVDQRIEAAATEFSQVLRYRPDHLLARINLGVALVRLGRPAEARAQFLEVLERDPQNTRARQHLDTLDRLLPEVPVAP